MRPGRGSGSLRTEITEALIDVLHLVEENASIGEPELLQGGVVLGALRDDERSGCGGRRRTFTSRMHSHTARMMLQSETTTAMRGESRGTAKSSDKHPIWARVSGGGRRRCNARGRHKR